MIAWPLRCLPAYLLQVIIPNPDYSITKNVPDEQGHFIENITDINKFLLEALGKSADTFA